jgi:abhydrolase domain-containing protein 6
VLVHGLGHWVGAAWDNLAAELGDRYDIIAFDLPGFGSSSKPDATYDLPFFVDVLERVIAHAGVDRFVLAGHSLGGMISAAYAAAHPANVRALVLIDPAGFVNVPPLVLYAAASPLATSFFSLRPSRRFVEQTLDRAVVNPNAVTAAVRERAFALSQDPQLRRAFARVYSGSLRQMMDLRNFHARLAGYTGPALIVWGARDSFVPIKGLDNARRVYPRAEVLVLPDAGHCSQVEFPAEVASAIASLGTASPA